MATSYTKKKQTRPYDYMKRNTRLKWDKQLHKDLRPDKIFFSFNSLIFNVHKTKLSIVDEDPVEAT